VVRPRSRAGRQIRRRLLVIGGLVFALAALVVLTVLTPPSEDERVTVFAAASLGEVLAEMETAFEAAYPGVDLVVSTAASSTLARQIEAGAPADVFLSASPRWTDYLAERGLLRYAARPIVGNELVVVGGPGVLRLASPRDLLRFDRVALGDEGVPAGDYARRALRAARVWEDVVPRIVPTRDVRAALAAVETGAAEVALVYRSDVVGAGGVQVVYEWPDALQPRIRYTIAVPRATEHANRALEFVEFVRASEQLSVWRRHGFTPLAETVL
jgi:molybdate transport system substrate-binding protein